MFLDKLGEIIDSYGQKKIPGVILGDVNIDVSKRNDSGAKNYLNLLSSMGCQNLINSFTRFEENCRSTLDHIVTNFDTDIIKHGILDHPITDHLPIFAMLKNVASPLKVKESD